MSFTIRWLTAGLEEDFYEVMKNSGAEAAHCLCTAYYGVDWEKGGAGHRAAMFQNGEFDGAILYDGEKPVGWAQCAPLGGKLVISRGVRVEPGDWGVSCVILRPERRREGLGTKFMALLLKEIGSKGAARALVIGRKPSAYDDPDEFVEFPEAICQRLGMSLIKDHEICLIYEKKL